MDEQTVLEHVPPMRAEVGQFDVDTLGMALQGNDEELGLF